MPNDVQDGGAGEERTVPETEYKSLQRKYNRLQTRMSGQETQIKDLTSSATRTERLLEGLTTLVSTGDDQMKSVSEALVQKNVAQRGQDTSASQLGDRLNQILDGADEDWSDAKFDSARAILDEVNKSGDLARGPEVERLIHAALDGSGEDIDAKIASAILADRQEHGRVDNSTSAATGGGRVRLSDLVVDPRSTSIETMRANAKKALDQAFGA